MSGTKNLELLNNLPLAKQLFSIQFIDGIISVAVILEFLESQTIVHIHLVWRPLMHVWVSKYHLWKMNTEYFVYCSYSYVDCRNEVWIDKDNNKIITHHKTVAIFDEDVSGATITFKKTLQIAFTNAVWQTTNVYSGSYHCFGMVCKTKFELIINKLQPWAVYYWFLTWYTWYFQNLNKMKITLNLCCMDEKKNMAAMTFWYWQMRSINGAAFIHHQFSLNLRKNSILTLLFLYLIDGTTL